MEENLIGPKLGPQVLHEYCFPLTNYIMFKILYHSLVLRLLSWALMLESVRGFLQLTGNHRLKSSLVDSKSLSNHVKRV